MAKFLKFDETAKMLGISEDELSQLREQQEIHGYRDGGTWKFKEDEVQRVAQQRATAPSQPNDEQVSSDSGELLDLPIDLEDDSDSADIVLLSERELGESDPGTSSTIIGPSGKPSPDESDVRIVTEEDRQGGDVLGGSDVRLVPASGSGKGSDVALVVSDEAVGETPDNVEPDAPTEIRSGLKLEGLADEATDIGVGTEETQSPTDAGSELSLGSDALDLSLDDELSLVDDDFEFGDEASAVEDDSVSALSDELVLETGPGSSDITRRPSESGISLGSPSDSGISLESPLDIEMDEPSLEVSATQEDEEFELAGDDLISLEDDGDSEELQEVGSGDDFLLTPIDESKAEEESDDSGSQVIALDSESDFGEADLLGGEEGGLLEEEPVAESGTTKEAAVAATSAPATVLSAGSREAQFTGLSVLSLGICVTLLAISGMMMFDLMRNMWAWGSSYSMDSALMDTVLGLFGG